MAHFSRKCYSTIKQQMETEAGYSAFLLSQMDTVFMATYAAGNIINGKLGDTFDPTIVLAIGLFGSGICLFLITVAIWFDFHGMSVLLGNGFILAVYFLFGFFQATGGPVGTAVMGNWFCDAESIKKRGTIFGFWTCHQYCGDVTAALCTAYVLSVGAPYWSALVIPASTNIFWALLTTKLIADPANVNIITPEVRIRQEKMDEKRRAMAEAGETMAEDAGPSAISYAGALAIPMVAQYAFAFGFFKLVNYVLFFWLPYFLGKTFDPVTANLIASLYSVGMMPGGIIVGLVSDAFGGRRAVVIGVFMSILIVFLAVFAVFSESGHLGAAPMLFMLACMGILVGGYVPSFMDNFALLRSWCCALGVVAPISIFLFANAFPIALFELCRPNNIITSAVAADLAAHPSVRGNSKSLGTVTGLINGCGSITASIGLLAVGPLQNNFGWGSVWIFLIGCTSTGTLLMSTKIYAELFSSPVDEQLNV